MARQAGDYRHKIVVQTLSDDEQWSDFATLHAHINGLGGSEYWSAAAMRAENTVDFEVRYFKALAGLIPRQCRISFRGLFYDINSIDDFEYRHVSLVFRGAANYDQ